VASAWWWLYGIKQRQRPARGVTAESKHCPETQTHWRAPKCASRVEHRPSTTNYFLPRDAMLPRYMLSSFVSVHPSVCHKRRYRNDWTNRVDFPHGGFLPPIQHCRARKIEYLKKLRYFPLQLCPKLRAKKILPQQVDSVFK